MTMTSLLHHLRKQAQEKYQRVVDFIVSYPFVLLLVGFCQLRCTELYPDETWKPFLLYELPKTSYNPEGVIHAKSWGAFFHEYVYYTILWIFCSITTEFKSQFKILIALELMDLVDFVIRYNHHFVTLLGHPLEYTDLKMASYFLIAYSTIQCKTSI
jgi:hypothetical protein